MLKIKGKVSSTANKMNGPNPNHKILFRSTPLICGFFSTPKIPIINIRKPNEDNLVTLIFFLFINSCTINKKAIFTQDKKIN
jgi:hypothetical protein